MSILLDKGNAKVVFEVLNNHNINSPRILDDKLKVLEIIKEKRVDLCILTDCDNVNEYNKSLGNFRPVGDRLTYEEFELLKRWNEDVGN